MLETVEDKYSKQANSIQIFFIEPCALHVIVSIAITISRITNFPVIVLSFSLDFGHFNEFEIKCKL